MTDDIPISELLDGELIRTASSEAAIEQEDVTYKVSARPNPPRFISALNQIPQLETSILGINLEVPNNTGVAVSIDATIGLFKSFKLGLASTLDIFSSTPNNTLTSLINTTFENTNPLDDIASLTINNLLLFGVGLNDVFNMHGGAGGLVRSNDAIYINFGSLGTIDIGNVIINSSATQGIGQGLIINEPVNVIIDTFGITQFASLSITAVSIIAGVNPVIATINNLRGENFSSGDSLLFIDPNSPPGSRYTISESNIAGGDFYQLGVDIVITGVANNGSDKARFTTASAHNLIIGRPTVISGFPTITDYNRTVIVTAVDTPLTGVTFDVEDISFAGTEAGGGVNNKSLDQESPLVIADANSSPDSMFIGEAGLEVFGAEITSSVLATNAFEVITSASWAFAKLERFEEDLQTTNQGRLIAKDVSSRDYNVRYKATIEKSGGSAGNIGIILLKNGSEIAFNPPHTVNSGKIQISGDDLIELTEDDAIQVAVKNYDGTATAILISQASLVVSKG